MCVCVCRVECRFYDDAEPATGVWWEWATDIPDEWGGVLSSNITSLAYDDDTGALYVATLDVLNIRYPNSTVERVDGLSGLPYTNLTSVRVQRSSVSGRTMLHMGTPAGTMSADITPLAGRTVGVNMFGAEVGGGGLAPPLPVSQWVWSYRFLERWLPGPYVVSVGAHAAAGGSPYVLVGTRGGAMPEGGVWEGGAGGLSGCGFALYEDQWWTLSGKAARMAAIQVRHDRYGMVSGCGLGSFGDTAVCVNGDDDNNGLWTSLVVAANALRFVSTGEEEAAALAWHYYDGMRLLNEITGIKVCVCEGTCVCVCMCGRVCCVRV